MSYEYNRLLGNILFELGRTILMDNNRNMYNVYDIIIWFLF